MSIHHGHCLCAQVSVKATGKAVEADACHCAMCRRQNAGGAFHAVHFDGDVTLTGESLKWYAASDHAERSFCQNCGSTIAWRLKDLPQNLSVTLGLFDTAPRKIDARIFVDDSEDYADIPQDVPHKTSTEAIAEFMARMEQN